MLRQLKYYQALTDAKKIQQVELWERSIFERLAALTYVKFIFTYCNNDFNQLHNRVGKISGYRIATTNAELIPAGDIPAARNPSSKTIRYYDITRAGTTVKNGISSGGLPGRVTSNSGNAGQWRSFRPSTFSIAVEVWSMKNQSWSDDFSEYIKQ